MNRAQNEAVEAIARAALSKSGTRGEFKEWEVRELGSGRRYYWIRVVSGMENDEGTAAALFCRYRGLFVVGPRGGISARSKSKHGTKRDTKRHPLIFGFES